ncbi:nuclear transport factor 2 family protein [Yinghuangia seranimata]|uniref:nuclear transport factor 2 family protein n=1 Tax=Yinghuangia seranimata TaxID=408067 RepID=UPI00248AD0B7|nr:nuclear transport factor 2 family protein [Yinghuangia seranimata]MDI2127293.1 nuclear transport factor 2 family protein [Yinghuangia seranimata]
MAEHPDVTLVKNGYAAFNRGDMDALRGMLTTDCVHHVPGLHQLSGHHKGVDACLDYYMKMGMMTDGTMKVELQSVMPDGRGHAISVHRITATREGRSIDTLGSLFFTIVGGKMSDIDECVEDLDLGNEFWG